MKWFFCLLPLTGLAGAQDFTHFRRHVEALAHDSMEGRGTGTEGERKAARYIAGQLETMRLRPLPSIGSYFQQVPMHGAIPLPTSRLILHGDSTTTGLQLNRDYVMLTSGAQTYIRLPVPLVFVGFGIVAPEYDHNDYQKADVDGKIAVMLDGEPWSGDETYFEGPRPTRHSFLSTKRKVALSQGARGSVIISWNPSGARSWHAVVQEYSQEDVTLNYEPAGHFSVLMNANTAQQLFLDGPVSLKNILDDARRGAVSSFPMNVRLSFDGGFNERDFVSQNVIGWLEGSDPVLKDTYLVVSAHYDHLGIGRSVDGDSIYNGAFDNAAGVAAVLEIARTFVSHRPRRSVIFLFPTGEEKGLLGSIYYGDHPVVPRYKTVANVNVDGIASFEKFRSVYAIGAELSDLESTVKTVLEGNNLSVRFPTLDQSYAEAFYRSDHFVFAQSGIPSLMVMEGLDYETSSRDEGLARMNRWYADYYHSPKDDAAQPMNCDAVLQHLKILMELILRLANDPSDIQWKKGVPYLQIRLQNIVEKR